jgi:tetratricopeptide (TPR) repeat protein
VYFNQEQDQDRALKAMEKAVELDGKDDRLLFELDQLYKKCGKLPGLRKKVLEKHLGLVFKRDDLTLAYVTLLNFLGSYGEAKEIELSHSFHPWEGGEGKIAAQYVVTQVELAKEALKENKTQEAGELLMQALSLPENLHEGKLDGNKDNEIHYFLGCVWEQAENHGQAKLHWELATRGLLTASTAMFYYDQSPTMLFYKGLALKKLGKVDEAQACFDELLNYGSAHSEDRITIDYFAVSLPDLQVFTEDISRRNTINCLYLMGLGNLGKGNNQEAEDAFRKVLEMDPNHWEGRRFLMSSFS